MSKIGTEIPQVCLALGVTGADGVDLSALNGLPVQIAAANPASVPLLAAAVSRVQHAAAAGGIANTLTAELLFPAAGASIRNYLTGLQLSWDQLGASPEVVVRDGVGGTIIWRAKLPRPADTLSIDFQSPLKGSPNAVMEIATLPAVTGGIRVNAQGFTGP